MPPVDMLDLLANGGLGGIVALTILAIIRGWLVPARSVNQLLNLHRAQTEAAVDRGNEWKQAAEAEEAARLALERQVLGLVGPLELTAGNTIREGTGNEPIR